MNVVAEYIFKIQSIGYRPPMERVAYYLLPVIPAIIFFTSIVLAYKGLKIRKFLYAFGFVALLLAVVFFLKIQLPGHRTEYWGWEGIRVWGIVPSQETAVVMFVSDFAAVAMALVGRAIGKVIRKHATNSRRS